MTFTPISLYIGLSMQSWVSAFFLSVFSMKLTLEAQKLKDEIFLLYYSKDQSSRQWIEIFERLPIGVLLVNEQKIVHFNE
jgi:c-di-AMP phosphodiesterase-like protein